MILLELFLCFFKIGLFSVGGGYAAMALIQNQVVDVHNWIDMTQFADIITIAEMTPGPIAINGATFVGIRMAGIPGALAATIGVVLGPSLIVLGLAYIYFKYRGLSIVKGILAGLRPAVIAMIASAGLSILILALYGTRSLPKENLAVLSPDFVAAGIFAAALFVLRKWKLNPIYVMAGAGAVGAILYSIV